MYEAGWRGGSTTNDFTARFVQVDFSSVVSCFLYQVFCVVAFRGALSDGHISFTDFILHRLPIIGD